jgi:hypothetical protein
VCVCVCVCAARRVVFRYRMSCGINCRSGKLMQHHMLCKFGQPRGSLWDVILSGITMGGSDIAGGLLLFLLSAILPIPLQVAPVTASTAHISRADDFIRADAEFVTIVFYSNSLSNRCTVQFACFHVKAVVEIYTGHVDFKNHFHMKTCKLQSFSHELKFSGDEAQCPRVVCPLNTPVNTQNTGTVRRRVLPSCMG